MFTNFSEIPCEGGYLSERYLDTPQQLPPVNVTQPPDVFEDTSDQSLNSGLNLCHPSSSVDNSHELEVEFSQSTATSGIQGDSAERLGAHQSTSSLIRTKFPV